MKSQILESYENVLAKIKLIYSIPLEENLRQNNECISILQI